jgi:hypothetical protein
MSWVERVKARTVVSGVVAACVVAVTLGGAFSDRDRAVRRVSARLVSPRLAAVVSSHRGSNAPNSSPGASSTTCSASNATAATTSVDATVAQRIYRGEERSSEVKADLSHIEGSGELLSSLTSSNEPAVYEAVHAIVYAPKWHIVRLRVVKGGRVLADVGGPHILAPVSGVLRLKGHVVGSFVMSVQDDVGYVKLVSRFIGVPIELYQAGAPLMGTLEPAPATVHNGDLVTGNGLGYRVHVVSAVAFPTGALQVALFVPDHTNATAGHSCAAVRLAAWGRIAMHIAARFKPLAGSYKAFVDTLQGSTGGVVFLREGSEQLAGPHGGPKQIPSSGTVTFKGRSWPVFSWRPTPRVRAYFLTP